MHATSHIRPIAHDRCSPDFEPLLAQYDRSVLADHPGTVIGVDSELKIAYLNTAWDAFAEENGGEPQIHDAWGIGADYLSAVPGPLITFYEKLFDIAKKGGLAKRPVQHVYECSSPVVFRKFQMNVYALADCSGLLIVNSLVVERPHDPQLSLAGTRLEKSAYEDSAGVIKQCCHCRRIERPGEAGCWDWISHWVEAAPENTSHSLCPICFHSYYSDLDLRPAGGIA